MILLRAGFCILALSMGAAAQAADGPRADACDVICDLQAYFNRDHMVTYVPAAPPPVSKPSKPVKLRPAVAKHLSHRQVASRKQAPNLAEVAPPVASAAGQTAPRQTAQWTPPLSTAAASPPRPPLIPGSAPLVTPQFASPGAM